MVVCCKDRILTQCIVEFLLLKEKGTDERTPLMVNGLKFSNPRGRSDPPAPLILKRR